MRFSTPLLLLGLLACSSVSHAWNGYGHRLVANLAEPHLQPEARAEVQRLLALEGASRMADVASWADELRNTDSELARRSTRWHFVNMAEDGCAFDAARHCAGGDCVVAAIREQADILADRSRPDAERLQALKFVIHFVGDAHQPMHAGYGHDRGGNRVQVHVHGKGSNLHALWDDDLLGSAGLDEAEYADRLQLAADRLPADVGPYTPSSPAVWAEQSCRIATTPGVYPEQAKIEAGYLDRHRPTAERQVQLGGARLAHLLNDVLM
ncbi:S1/P1 nuclease [Luteimonas sp. SDU101]|uniref:S1/P1 nuclease n=1 Tax=Luteimonas sp. SDU101 TaxID=3422593 RepID=UPI003EB7B750